MLYKHSGISLWYVLCALPVITLVTGYEEVALSDIMVDDILDGKECGLMPCVEDKGNAR
jgi:hypothetical protein